MTNYDEARQGSTDRRHTEARRPHLDVIDGEVVAVEVHDDMPPRVGPAAPDGGELQDSLDQIERLAAELKEIAEVITPSPQASGRRAEAPAGNLRPPRPPWHGEAGAPSSRPSVAPAGQAGAPAGRGGQPAAPAGWAGRPTEAPAQPAGPSGRVGRPAESAGRAAGPNVAAGRATAGSAAASGQAAAGSKTAPGCAGESAGRATVTGPRFEPHNAPTSRPAPQAADETLPIGTSKVQEPLPPEPKRRGDEDLVFGMVAGPSEEGPRAEKTLVDTAALPVQEIGVAKSSAKSAKGKAPAGRSESESRRPGGRSVSRGRYTAIIIGAFALAVPAFALGAVQPWNTSAQTEDKLSVAIGDRAGAPPVTGGDPATAVPNASPSPSIAVQPPVSPREVNNGAGSGQPKTGPATTVPKTPPTHQNRHPVGLSLTVHADDVKPTAGETVRFTMTWKDGSGHFAGATQQWGDGSPAGGSVNKRSCTGQAPASSGTTMVTHSFREAGTYTVKLSVTTYTCDGKSETQTVPMTITVQPKPSPTPSSSPTPSESPSPED